MQTPRVTAYDAERWVDLAEGTAGASAALAGLLFVAVSLNLQAILEGPRLANRAAQALVLLVFPVFTGLALLVPDQSPVALGTELVLLAVVLGVLLNALARPDRRPPDQPRAAWFATGVVPALVVPVGTLLAGVGVLTEALGGLYWLPVVIAVGLFSGLVNTWVLLVEILR